MKTHTVHKRKRSRVKAAFLTHTLTHTLTHSVSSEESQVEVKAARRKSVRKRKKRMTEEEEERGGASESEEEEPVDIDRQLDKSLETKSKQHNLTTVNVRNIIHVSI